MNTVKIIEKQKAVYGIIIEIDNTDYNDNKLLKKLKTGFKRTIKWNKYISVMSNQTKNNNLNYLIDPTFTNVNRTFVLSFENEDDRTFFQRIMSQKLK